jgi:aspartyl/asparaginyl beta-hydroxylase (cupin superfamily)
VNADEVLAGLYERMGRDGLERVEECVRILSGEAVPEYLHDDQEPTRLFFPEIAALPWHDTAAMPWVAEVEAAFPRIKKELTALVEAGATFSPYEDLYTKELGWSGWDTFSIYRSGEFREEAERLCPVTVETLRRTPHGPRDGMFTILRPGTHLTPHTGGVNILLTCHLALIVPPDCAIRVAEETRAWEEGRCLLFDDSFIHEAWNRSDRIRSVLLWDVWHPDLRPREIEALEHLLPQFQRYLMGD